MPIHDWTRVVPDLFHDFHGAWIAELRKSVNGLLPKGYYALTEQHAQRTIPDILTLHTSRPDPDAGSTDSLGGVALADAPPKVQRRLTASDSFRKRQRTLAVRQVHNHRLVAMIEIVSRANKDRERSVVSFAAKLSDALQWGVNVLMVDILPPGRHDPQGMHGAVWSQCDNEPYEMPPGEPLVAASYLAREPVEAFIEHLTVGRTLPDMPLFLCHERYIPTPLEASYTAAYEGGPQYWREVIEGVRVHEE